MLRRGTSPGQTLCATVLDLAVRGYLQVQKVPGKNAWDLARVQATGRHEDTLLRYEKLALDVLFFVGNRRTVRVGMTGVLHDASLRVEKQRLADCAKRRWRLPDSIHLFRWEPWLFIGIGCVAMLLLGTTGLPLLGLGTAVAGAVLIPLARHGRAHGGMHTELDRRSRALGKQLRTTTLDGVPEAERADLFSRQLPYAVAVGHSQTWLDTFAPALGQARLPWYPSAAGSAVTVKRVRGFMAAFWKSANPGRQPTGKKVHSSNSSYDTGSYSTAYYASGYDAGSSGVSGGDSGGGGSW